MIFYFLVMYTPSLKTNMCSKALSLQNKVSFTLLVKCKEFENLNKITYYT